MITMSVEKKTELLKKLLNNVEYQIAEFIATRDFNKKALGENPAQKDKIIPLIITVESDIKQSFEYAEFIKNEIEELNKKNPEEILIILEDKKNEKN